VGSGAVSPAVKRPTLASYYSPPFSAGVKKCAATAPLPLRFHGVVLKHSDNFTLILLPVLNITGSPRIYMAKGNVKLSLCLIKHHAMKTYGGGGRGMAPPFLTWALDGGELNMHGYSYVLNNSREFGDPLGGREPQFETLCCT
jgi:hypothetical protein